MNPSAQANIAALAADLPRADRALSLRELQPYWLILLAAALFAAPGLAALARDVWSTEQGAGGPIILATGLWLLWHEAQYLFRRAAQSAQNAALRPGLAALGVLVFGALTVLAAILGKLWVQWAAGYLALVMALAAFVSLPALRRLAFPLVYLGFLTPPPQGIIVPFTRSLRLGIADWSVALLGHLGFNVAISGASLFIDGYELVIAAACSGLNSLVSLLAVGLFYVNLRHFAGRAQGPHWAHALGIVLCIVPIAIASNLLRVLLLLLLTHYAGDALAQGLLHEATGLTTFAFALMLLFVCDFALTGLAGRRGSRRSALAPAGQRS